jgi:UDP:flavonoid glycosyltransferase YjiC (YdhE family)
VFERQYNADSIERLGIGKHYLDSQFNSGEIVQAVNEVEDQKGFVQNICHIPTQLTNLGGTDTIIRNLSGTTIIGIIP